MAKQLNVNVAVTADTGQAKAQLQQLQTQLQQLSMSSSNLQLGINASQIREASQAATELAAHLKQATNIQTGTLDFSKLNTSINNSGKTLIEYGNQLQKLGPQGQQAFQQLAQAVAQSEIPVKRVSALFGEFGTVLKNTIRWQLSSSMIHGFMGGIQQAYRYAQNLNESLNRIQIVTQNSDTQMAKFAETANKAAKSLSTTTTTYTDAALIYYQQGLNAKQVEERTNVTIKMANAAGVSAKTVSDQMTAVWNNFADGSKSLEYYADVMTALGAATASSTDEISTGLSKFATVANTVGLSYENAAAALATITATTRNSADSVGTGLRTLFSRLQSIKLGETLEDGVDLTKYTKALETVGVRALDATGELRSMDDILEDLGGKWQTLTNTQKVALSQTVGGVRQYTNLIALMDNFDFYKRNQDIALTSEGTVQKQADIYAKSWDAAQKRVRASAESIYSDLINDKFFIGLTDGFAKVLDSVDSLIDRIGGLKGVLLTIGSVAGQLFSGQIANGLYKIGTAFSGIFVNEQKARSNFITRTANQMAGIGKDPYLISDTRKDYANFMATQLKYQNEFAKNSQAMSPLQQMTARMTLDNYGNLMNQYWQQGQKYEVAKNNLSDARSTLFSNVRTQGTKYANMTPVQVMRDIKARTGQSNIPIPSDWFSNGKFSQNQFFKAYGKSVENDIIKPTEQIERVKTIFNNFTDSSQEGIKSFTKTLSKAGVDVTKFKGQIFEGMNESDINSLRENMIDSLTIKRDGNAEALAALYGIDISSDAYKDFQKKLDDFAKGKISRDDLKKSLEGYKGNLKDATLAKGAMNVAQGFTQLATGAMSFISASNGIENIKDTLDQIHEGTLDASDGFKTLATNGVNTALQLSMGFSSVLKGLTSLGMGGGLATVLSLLGTLASVVVPLINDYIDSVTPESYNEQYERLSEAASRASDQAKEADNAYQTLLSQKGSHNELLNTLQSLTAGTLEFRDALLQANKIAQEIIDTNNLSYGSDWNYDERGIIRIKDTAYEKALETAQRKREVLAQNELIGQVLQGGAQAVRDRDELSERISQPFSKYSNDEGYLKIAEKLGNSSLAQDSTFNGKSPTIPSITDTYDQLLSAYLQFKNNGTYDSFATMLQDIVNLPTGLLDAWNEASENSDTSIFDTALKSLELNQQYKANELYQAIGGKIISLVQSAPRYFTTAQISSILEEELGGMGLEDYIDSIMPQFKAQMDSISKYTGSYLQGLLAQNGKENNAFELAIMDNLRQNEFTSEQLMEMQESIGQRENLNAQTETELREVYKEELGFMADLSLTKNDLVNAIMYDRIRKNIEQRYIEESNKYYTKVGYMYKNTSQLTGKQLADLKESNKELDEQGRQYAAAAQEQASKDLLQSSLDFISTTATFWNAQGLAIPEILSGSKASIEALQDFSKEDWDYLTDQAHKISGAFGDKAAGIMMGDLLSGYKSNTELAAIIRGQNFTGSSIHDIGSLNKLRKSKTLTETAQAQVEEYYNAALEGIGGNKGLFEELYHSDEFADNLKALRKELKKTGKIGADSIAAMAEESDFLNEFLDESVFTAQSLADVLQMLELGDIGIEGLSEELLKALGASKELDNNLASVFGHIDNYKKERSVQDIGKFYKGLADDIQSGWTSGMLLDKPLLQAWEEMFGAESAAEYRSSIYKATNDRNLTPQQISDEINTKWEAEQKAMESIQKNGNLSGMFEYYANQGGFKNMFSYNKETGQVTAIDRDKLIARGLDSQETWIDTMIAKGVPEYMAKAMAAEYATTNGNIAQLWNTTAAEKGIGQLLGQAEGTRVKYENGKLSGVTSEVGGILTGAELRTFWKANKDVLKDVYDTESKFMEAMQDGAKSAHKAFVDLGEDFNFTKASAKDLKDALSDQGFDKKNSIKDFVEQAGYDPSNINDFSTALQKLGYSAAQSFEVIDGYLADNELSIKKAFFGDDPNDVVYGRFEKYMKEVKGLNAEVATAANVADFMKWDEATQQAEAAAKTMADAITSAFADLFANLEIQVNDMDGTTITFKVNYEEENKPEGPTSSGSGGSGGTSKTTGTTASGQKKTSNFSEEFINSLTPAERDYITSGGYDQFLATGEAKGELQDLVDSITTKASQAAEADVIAKREAAEAAKAEADLRKNNARTNNDLSAEEIAAKKQAVEQALSEAEAKRNAADQMAEASRVADEEAQAANDHKNAIQSAIDSIRAENVSRAEEMAVSMKSAAIAKAEEKRDLADIAEGELESTRAQVQAVKNQISYDQDSLNKLETRATELESNYSKLEDGTDLKDVIADYNNQIEASKENMTKAFDEAYEVFKAQKEADDLKDQISNLDAKKAELEAQQTALDEQKTNLLTEKNNLDTQLNNYEVQKAQLEQQLEDLRSKRESQLEDSRAGLELSKSIVMDSLSKYGITTAEQLEEAGNKIARFNEIQENYSNYDFKERQEALTEYQDILKSFGLENAPNPQDAINAISTLLNSYQHLEDSLNEPTLNDERIEKLDTEILDVMAKIKEAESGKDAVLSAKELNDEARADIDNQMADVATSISEVISQTNSLLSQWETKKDFIDSEESQNAIKNYNDALDAYRQAISGKEAAEADLAFRQKEYDTALQAYNEKRAGLEETIQGNEALLAQLTAEEAAKVQAAEQARQEAESAAEEANQNFLDKAKNLLETTDEIVQAEEDLAQAKYDAIDAEEAAAAKRQEAAQAEAEALEAESAAQLAIQALTEAQSAAAQLQEEMAALIAEGEETAAQKAQELAAAEEAAAQAAELLAEILGEENPDDKHNLTSSDSITNGSKDNGTSGEPITVTDQNGNVVGTASKGVTPDVSAANDYWKSVEKGFWGGGGDNVYGTSDNRAWWAKEHIKNAAANGDKGAQAFQEGLFSELGISSWSDLTTEGLGKYLDQLSKVDEQAEAAAEAEEHKNDADREATEAAEAAAKAQENREETDLESGTEESSESVPLEGVVKEVDASNAEADSPVDLEGNVTDVSTEDAEPSSPVKVEAEVNEESLPEDQEAKVNYVLGTQDLPQDKTANVNYALGSQVPPRDMTAYVHYKRGSQEGPVGDTDDASGYNNGNGAFAGGKHNNGDYWGLATVGELGPELQIHRGMPYLVGISGRTQTYVEPGDSIFTAAETQKILENNPTLQDIPGFSVGYNQVSWGKSSGGVGAGDGKNKKTKEFDPERYHLITRQLADITRWYDRLDKIKDKAFGRNKIKAIQDEIDVTNDLIKAQQALIDEAKKYRDQDLQRLKDLGISFNLDANGNITNWDELQEQYGRVATEAEDEDTKKAAADRWKAIQQYEETIDKLHEAEEGLADYIMQLSELTLETITVEVDYKLEYDERGMDYLQHFIDKLEDNIYETAARFQLIGAQVDTFNHKINSSLQGINDIFEKMTDQEGNAIEGLTIAKFLAMTPEERENLKLNSEYVESIDKYLQSMMDDAEGLEKLKTTGIDMIKQGFDELNDSVEKQIDLFDHYNSLLESLQNISDLTGKSLTKEAKALTDALSEAKLNNTLNNLSSLQQQYKAVSEARKTLYDQYINETDETLRKAYKEEYDRYTDNLNEIQEQILSVHVDGLQQITDKFQAAMDDIIKIYQNSFSEIGDLSFLQGMYDRQREIDEQYEHDYEKYYRLSKLERDINKTIDTLSISSGRRNKALGAILEEVNQAQKEGKAMSEYDLELLRKKYEVEKARAELEEARDAKSTVRLQRNNNGTWGYVYTANEDNIAELEQKLEDSVYELQKFNEEYNQKLIDSFFRMAQDMGDLVSGDIWKLLMSPIEEERKQGFAQMEEINAQYGQISAYTMEQMKHAWEGNQWSLDFALEIYKNKMKDDGTAFNDLTDTFTETTISTITGAQSAEEWVQTITTNMQDLLDSAQIKIEEYLGKIDEINQRAGLSAGNITEQIITMTQAISASSDETADSVEQLSDTLAIKFKEIAENARLWEETFVSSIQNMVEQTEQLVTVLGNAVNILGLGNDLLNAYNIGTSAVLRQDVGYQWGTPSQIIDDISTRTEINDEVVSAAMKAIKLYESMPETIGGIGLLNAPALMDQLSQMLEQEVTIHAEFPNVTDHYEIEQAFNNLVNKATQYANEKRNG